MLPKKRSIPKFEHHYRFLSKISINDKTGCWDWMAGKNKAGYGKYCIGRYDFMAHRVSYSIFIEQPDENLVLDHFFCKNKSCCNPDHLRQVTHGVNTLENSVSASALNKKKTHCKKGHLFSLSNTRIAKNGQRVCRSCENASGLAKYYRLRNA